jgi:hypothetical protein
LILSLPSANAAQGDKSGAGKAKAGSVAPVCSGGAAYIAFSSGSRWQPILVYSSCIEPGKRKGKTQDTKTVLVFKLDKGVVADVTEFQSDYPTVAQFCKVHTGSRLARVRRAHAAIMSAAVKNEKLMAAM